MLGGVEGIMSRSVAVDPETSLELDAAIGEVRSTPKCSRLTEADSMT